VRFLLEEPSDAVCETAPVRDRVVDALWLDDPAGDDVCDLGGTMGADDSAEMAAIARILGCKSEPVFEAEAECVGRHRAR
jgi:hypothetical protein